MIPIFFRSQDYKKLSNKDKDSNSWLLNRWCSIQHPTISAELSRNGVNSVALVDFWQMVLSRHYKHMPNWSLSKENSQINDEYIPSKEAITMFCNMNRCGLKEYKDAMVLNEDKMLKELQEIEKYLDTTTVKNKKNTI